MDANARLASLEEKFGEIQAYYDRMKEAYLKRKNSILKELNKKD